MPPPASLLQGLRIRDESLTGHHIKTAVRYFSSSTQVTTLPPPNCTHITLQYQGSKWVVCLPQHREVISSPGSTLPTALNQPTPLVKGLPTVRDSAAPRLVKEIHVLHWTGLEGSTARQNYGKLHPALKETGVSSSVSTNGHAPQSIPARGQGENTPITSPPFFLNPSVTLLCKKTRGTDRMQ